MFCKWLELITYLHNFTKINQKRIVVVVVCIGIFEMDICACMQTYMLYINTKCASGVCTQDANGIDRFTIIKSTYLEK